MIESDSLCPIARNFSKDHHRRFLGVFIALGFELIPEAPRFLLSFPTLTASLLPPQLIPPASHPHPSAFSFPIQLDSCLSLQLFLLLSFPRPVDFKNKMGQPLTLQEFEIPILRHFVAYNSILLQKYHNTKGLDHKPVSRLLSSNTNSSVWHCIRNDVKDHKKNLIHSKTYSK